jgi:hypothetical protein
VNFLLDLLHRQVAQPLVPVTGVVPVTDSAQVKKPQRIRPPSSRTRASKPRRRSSGRLGKRINEQKIFHKYVKGFQIIPANLIDMHRVWLDKGLSGQEFAFRPEGSVCRASGPPCGGGRAGSGTPGAA